MVFIVKTVKTLNLTEQHMLSDIFCPNYNFVLTYIYKASANRTVNIN
jgi:hypothetical protein